MRRLGQARKVAMHYWLLFQLSQRNQSADAQAAFAVGYDPIESANAFQVYHARRTRDVILHRSQKILAAGDWSRGVVGISRRGSRLERADGFIDSGWTYPFKSLHAGLLSRIRFRSPIRILSGVIGNSRTRTPHAL